MSVNQRRLPNMMRLILGAGALAIIAIVGTAVVVLGR